MLELLYSKLQSDLSRVEDDPNDTEEIRSIKAASRQLAKASFDYNVKQLIKANSNNDELLSEIKKLNENMSKLLEGQKEANNRLDDIHFRQSFYS